MNKNQIQWLCRRGMLELDIILNYFFENHYDELTQSEKDIFQKLLQASDPDLYQWLMGYQLPNEEHFQNIVNKIQQSRRVFE